jgi:hypothetical protein
MSKRLVLVGAVVVMSVGVGIGWTYARAAESKPSLTALDYAQIQNLYTTYTRYTDMGGGGDGSDYASLFTPDASFNTNTGHEALKKMIKNFHAKLQREGWSSRHTYTGLVINPTAEGAKGSVYLLTFNVTAKPPFVDHSGVYEDWLVKTKDGWKFKKRIYRSSETFKPSMPQGSDDIFHP